MRPGGVTALNSLPGGGMGIHRKDPARNDFDYGAEYRAKVGGHSLHI